MLTVVGENVACSGTQRVLELEDKVSAGDGRFYRYPAALLDRDGPPLDSSRTRL